MKNERYGYIYYSKDFDSKWDDLIDEHVELLQLYIDKILHLTFYIGSKKHPTITYPCLILKVWKDTTSPNWIGGQWSTEEFWMVKYVYMVDSQNSTRNKCHVSQIVDIEEVSEEDYVMYKLLYG